MLKKLIGIGLAAIVALLVVLAWDRHEDAKAFNLAMDYCGPGNVKSIDTKGLFSTEIICRNGIKHSL